MAEKVLNAILSGKGSLAKTLGGIADSADDSSDALKESGESASAASKAFSTADDKGEDLSDTLSGMVDNATTAAESLDLVEESAEDTKDAFWSASSFVNEYTEELRENTAVASAASSANKMLSESIDEVGDQASESIPEVLAYNSAIASSVGASGLGSVDTDVDGSGFSFSAKRSVLSVVPILSGRGDTKNELSGFADTLKNALNIESDIDVRYPVKRAKKFTKQLERIGESNPKVKVEIENADSFKNLLSRLKSIENISLGDLDIPERDSNTDGLFNKLLDGPPDVSLSERFDSIDTSNYERRISIPVDFDRDRSWSLPDVSLPNFDRDRSWSLPGVGLPDIDVPNLGRIAPDLSGITRTGGRAANVLGDVGQGFALITGNLRKMRGLGKIVGIFGRLGSLTGAAGALAGVASALGAFAALGTIIAAVIDLTAAIGGLVVAIGGLGAALVGLLGVGLWEIGADINARSKKIKTNAQGIQAYLSGLQDEAKKALQPIFSLPTKGFVKGFLKGGLNTLADYSTMVKSLFPDIKGMFDRLGEVWSANQPEFFLQLEKTIRAFLPMIEGFIAWFINSAPKALKFMRGMGKKLLPKLIRMFGAMWGAIEPFLPAGAAFASIVMDLVTLFFELITPISEIVGFGLTPILQGLAWAMDLLAGGTKYLSDAFSGLMDSVNSWVAGIWEAMNTLSALEIGKLLWNLIIGGFEMITNAVIAGIEGMVNFVFDAMKRIPGVKKALKKLGVPKNVDLGKVNFDNLKTDFNGGKPGKQTSMRGLAKKKRKESRKKKKKHRREKKKYGDKYEFNMNFEGGKGNMSSSQWKRAVKEAFKESKREERLRNSNLTG